MIDRVIAAQAEVDEHAALLDAAKERRAVVFALAQEREGMSSGDIARVLPVGVLPHHVAPIVRVGRGLLRFARARRDCEEFSGEIAA